MAFHITIKNSITNKRPNNLARGELAYSFASGDSGQTLYIGSADSGISFAIGGAFFTDMLDHTKGVLTPNSAIITDANNKIDKLLVDNTTFDSGDIRTDGNLSLLPSGGSVLVSGTVRTTGQFVGVYAGFDSDFGLKTTDDLTEGSTNLYYTTARHDSDTLSQVDSAYIRARQLTDFPYVDSAMVSRMIDSATGGIDSAVLTRIINLQTIDSAQVDQMLDSAINAFGIDSNSVDQMIDSAVGFLSTNSRPGIHGLIDSTDVDQMIDSAIGAFHIDSASVDQMIDSALQFASTNSRPGQHGLIDSQDVDQMIDSAVSKTHIDTLEIDAGTLDGINSSQFLRSDEDDTISANLTVDSNLVIGGQLHGPANFIIDPATIGDNTGTVQILGNLQVQGTQTTINSTTVSLNDKNLVLADSAADSAAADGAGLTINGAGATLTYSASLDDFVFNKPITAPNINVDTITVTETIVGGYAGFDSDFSQKSTSDLSEGTNLYHTKARVQTLLDSSGHLDSTGVDQMIDSAIGAFGIDSNSVNQMIDSAIGFLSTNSRPGVHGLIDSVDVDQMLDSAFGSLTPDPNDAVFSITAGSGIYIFDGDGFTGATNNPALYLTRGMTYKFSLNVSSHPFYIKTTNSTGTGNQYTDGVTGNGTQVGDLIFEVPMNAPNQLHYNCSIHSAMNAPIYIMDMNSFIDSDEVDRMLDSALTAREALIDQRAIDSALVMQMVDSSNANFGNPSSFVDSIGVDQMIDSAFGAFTPVTSTFTAHALDSNATDQMIDSAITGPIRSHIQAFGFLDSNLIDQMFDSHQSNVTHGGGGGGGGGGLDSNAVDQMFDSHLSNVLHSGGAGGGLDSNPIQRMIDSSAFTGDSADIRRMIDSDLDSAITGPIRTHIQSFGFVANALDSNSVDQMLDSAFNAFTPATSTFTAHALDSNAVDQMFDSHLSNVTHGGGGGGTGGLDSAETLRITRGQVPTSLTITNFMVTADSNQGEFTRDSDDVAISIDSNQFQVYLNGLLLPEDEYTFTNTSVTLRTVTDSGDQLQIIKTNGKLSTLNQTIFEYAVDSNNTTAFSGNDRNGKSLAFNRSDQQSVYLNGILQTSEDFSINTSTNTLTLNVGADSGDLLQIVRISGNSINNGLDSNAVDQMFDSHVSNLVATTAGVDSGSIQRMIDSNFHGDSAVIQRMIDSQGHIDSAGVDAMIDSAIGFLSTNSRPGVHGLLDSTDIDQMLDSAFGAFTPGTGTFTAHALDSNAVDQMFDSAIGAFHIDSGSVDQMIDSAIGFLSTNSRPGIHGLLDSNAVDQMFDSHMSNVTHGGGGGGGGGLDSAAVSLIAKLELDSARVRLIADSSTDAVEFKQTQFFFRADSIERDFFADSDGNALSLDSGAFQVYLNGLLLPQVEYYNTKTSFHLTTSADSGDNISLIKFTGNNIELTKRGLTETRYFFTTASPTTSITGADDNGVTLDYSDGLVDVYLNGILLKDSDDFTTNAGGTAITLVSATDSSDVVAIINKKGVVVTPSLKKFEYTATAGQTVFTGADLHSTTLSYVPGAIQVHVNGILLKDIDFSTNGNGTAVTLVESASLNDDVVISTFAAPGANLTLFKYVADSGQTVFTGADAASNTLSYMPSNIQLFMNGLLLNDSDDYTAQNGQSVILNTAAAALDEIKIVSFVNNNNNLRVNAWSDYDSTASTAVAGDKLFVNTLSGAHTITLPASANKGDEIRVIDAEGNAATNNITIGRNSHRIMGADSDFIINLDRAAIGFVYFNDSNGWLLLEN